MNKPAAPDGQGTSTRPYLVRGLHGWCTDNGFTPYIAVNVDATVQVPMAYVKNNEIVLNIGFEATTGLKLGNDFIEFRARFGGVSFDILVPLDHVVAIYARENGQGMAFPMPSQTGAAPASTEVGDQPGRGGLRLATSPAASDAPAAPKPSRKPAEAGEKTGAPVGLSDAADNADPPEPPPAGPSGGSSGGRPALKRIK